MVKFGRTDMASEAHRLWQNRADETGALPGVKATEQQVNGFSLTSVEILDEEGARALQKPKGRYFCYHLPSSLHRYDDGFLPAVELLSSLIRHCLPSGAQRFLIAALGNPDVTPDALGSLCAEYILITRHLKENPLFQHFQDTALTRTGVLGTTGMESAFQIRALCQALKPDCILAVDALAGAETEDLCRSIQVCDAGIAPGSGVGNDREALDESSLGIPVLAIGVPTVIDAASLSGEEGMESLFVTPRYIDSSVRQLARLIAYGINLALHPGLSVEDMEMLVDS